MPLKCSEASWSGIPTAILTGQVDYQSIKVTTVIKIRENKTEMLRRQVFFAI